MMTTTGAGADGRAKVRAALASGTQDGARAMRMTGIPDGARAMRMTGIPDGARATINPIAGAIVGMMIKGTFEIGIY